MIDELMTGTLVPLWLKVAWTAMVLVIVVVYWRYRGPDNLLWFSDLALLVLVPGLWMESSFVVSLTACTVLVPEALWSVSFFARLFHLPRVTNIADYMFDEPVPLWLRAMSLFHVPLLAVIVWGPWRLGYDPSVFPWAVGIAWIVMLLTRWLTKPEPNINHVYELPIYKGPKLAPLQHMLVMMAATPLVMLPGHLLLWLLFTP